MSYAYGYGFSARMAMQTYLATIGREKVGFTITERQPTASRSTSAACSGLLERNTMRYYLAIDAYLGAYSAAAGRAGRAAHPRVVREHRALCAQLHEMDRGDLPRDEAQGSAAPAG